jgi:hypothetical protein
MISVVYYNSIVSERFNDILISDNHLKTAYFVHEYSIRDGKETYKHIFENQFKTYTKLFDWND